MLKIRGGNELLAIAARGSTWEDQYGLKARQLTNLPRRLMNSTVWFDVWEDHFTIANFRYEGVVTKAAGNTLAVKSPNFPSSTLP